MKFGRYLKEHAIVEWHTAYIKYRVLKKQINKAVDELDSGVVTSQQQREDPDDPPPATPRRTESPTPLTKSPRASPSARQAFQRSSHLESGSTHEEGEADDEDETPRGRVPSSHGHDKNEPPLQPLPPAHLPISPGVSGVSFFSRSSAPPPTIDSDDTGASGAQLVRPDQQRQNSSGSGLRRRRGNSFITPANEVNPSKWRKPYSADWSLEKLYDTVPRESRKFFVILDRELDRIEGFYKDREKEAVQRFEELGAQWKELADHKKEFQAFREREMRPPSMFKPVLKTAKNVPGSNLVRRSLAQRRDRSMSRERGPGAADHERRRQDDAGEEGESAALRHSVVQSSFQHGRPEEYASAKSKLKLATFEFYRQLGMLKSYRVLNRTGFAKGLKKFEKSTLIPASKQYTPKVDACEFVASQTLDDIIRKVEDAFASVFEHGNRKKALERLRDFGQRKMHHLTSWRSGVYMGVGLVWTIEGFVKSQQAATQAGIPYWPALLQLFGAMLLPVLFGMAFYLNILAWSYARINYVLIFELDVRTRLDSHQVIELPALLFFLWSLTFWGAFSNFWPNYIAPSAYPLAFLVAAMVILLNPFPIWYPSARGWLVRSFSRVATSGLIRVEFRDFFLGDELNSIYYTFVNLGFMVCTYNHHWPDDVNAVCSTNKTWTTPVLASLPALFRLGQSIRRYIDSDGLRIHALNAGKYTGSIFYFFFYYHWRIRGSPVDWSLALFVLFATLNSCYTATWDIFMDWSLGRKNSKHWLLRPELGFKEHVSFYYVAVVIDVLLRFAWVQYLYLGDGAPSVQLRGYIAAVLEVFRRIMWNGLRVESEHLGNVDGYRVTRNVPLPYITLGSVSEQPEVHSIDEDLAADAPLQERLLSRLRVWASWPAQAGNFVQDEILRYSTRLRQRGRQGGSTLGFAGGDITEDEYEIRPQRRKTTTRKGPPGSPRTFKGEAAESSTDDATEDEDDDAEFEDRQERAEEGLGAGRGMAKVDRDQPEIEDAVRNRDRAGKR